MPAIYLVRHGEYENPDNINPGRLPVKLSEKGRRQIAKVRDYLRDKDIAKIYSSPVERCKESAGIISDGKLEVIYDVRLAETLGVAQGQSHNNWILPYYGKAKELGGETVQQVQDRMVEFWEENVAKSTENLVISSHGDPLHLLRLHLIGDTNLPDMESEIFDDYPPMGSCRPVTIENGKVSVGSLIDL